MPYFTLMNRTDHVIIAKRHLNLCNRLKIINKPQFCNIVIKAFFSLLKKLLIFHNRVFIRVHASLGSGSGGCGYLHE